MRIGIYSLDDLKRDYYHKTRGHWFDKDTMRFFRSRLSETLYHGTKLIYFVSSEQNHSWYGTYPRMYTIRSYNPENGDIENVVEFQEYKSSSGAHGAIKRLVAKQWEE